MFEKERARHIKSLPITISTRVPSKWRFVDLETGEIWRWDEGKAQFLPGTLDFDINLDKV